MSLRAATVVVILSSLGFSPARAQPPAVVQDEVEFLLRLVETGGCSFYRNGSWYDGAQASTHLRDKYDYLVARNLISSAEDFIDKAASKSSISGKPYEVRCGDSQEVESGAWLRRELAHHRAIVEGTDNPPAEPQQDDPS